MSPLVKGPFPISNPAARDLPFQQDFPPREMQQTKGRHGKELAHRQGGGGLSLTPESLVHPLSGPLHGDRGSALEKSWCWGQAGHQRAEDHSFLQQHILHSPWLHGAQLWPLKQQEMGSSRKLHLFIVYLCNLQQGPTHGCPFIPFMGQAEQGADRLSPSTTKDPSCPGPIPSEIPPSLLGGLSVPTMQPALLSGLASR